MVRPNGESAPWMTLVNSRWVMPCGLSFWRAMALVTAVSAIFSRAGSNAGLRSTSAKASMTAGTSALSALIDAEPESAPMPGFDRGRAGLEELVERVRLARRRAAAPQHRADETGEAGLLGRLEQRAGADARRHVDERQLVILDHHHHHPVRQDEAGRLRRREGRQRRIGDLGRLGDLGSGRRCGGNGQDGRRGQGGEAVQAVHRAAPEGEAAAVAVSILATVRLASTNVAAAALRTSALVTLSRRST